jgi:hypothetical protein
VITDADRDYYHALLDECLNNASDAPMPSGENWSKRERISYHLVTNVRPVEVRAIDLFVDRLHHGRAPVKGRG